MIQASLRVLITPVLASMAFSASAAAAVETDATSVVDKAEVALWGRTFNADFDMTITTSRWTRTLSLQVWMDRPGKSFLRVVAPAKDAGITSLRIEQEMWNYIPAIERTIKVPPSLMLQPWLGSDFTNDDLMKESSLVNDYTHRLLESPNADGSGRYVIEALPKPQSAVVWGKVIYSVRADFLPQRLEYFDERGRLVRTQEYTDVRKLDGRDVPTRWEMTPSDKPGKSTVISIKNARYNKPLNDGLFSLRNLTSKE